MRVFLVLLVATSVAHAQAKSADDYHREGETAYSLRDFETAIVAFKAAYAAEHDLTKRPVHLFNLAQAYRFGNHCADALFTYRRFLKVWVETKRTPVPPETESQVDAAIAELEVCAKSQQQLARQPPTNVAPPSAPIVADKPVEPTPEPEPETEEAITETTPPEPRIWVIGRIGAGAVVTRAGNLDVPVSPAVTATITHPLAARVVDLELGIAASWGRIGYRTEMAEHTTSLVGVMAVVRGGAPLVDRFSLHGELAFGVQWWSGLAAGNPFTDAGAAASGAVALPHVRLAAVPQYAIIDNLHAWLAVAGAYSLERAGLASSLATVELLAGIGASR